MFKTNQFGQFDIDKESIEADPDLVQAILGSTIIVRAEALVHPMAIRYTAWCGDFDEIATGEEAPFYDIEIDQEAETMTWQRRAA